MSRRTRIVGSLAVFAVFVVFDWLYWEVLFPGLSSTPVSWLWFHSASAVLAVCFVALFSRGWMGSGAIGGLRFGLTAGLFWVTSEFMLYALKPEDLSSTLGNVAGDLGMFVLAGLVIGLLDRRSAV